MSDSRLVAEEARTTKRLLRVCWEEWLRGRSQTRIPSFNSKSAKAKVVEFSEQALRVSDDRDVLQAVHEVSREGDGFPWDIPKRAMYLGSQRRDLENLARKLEERREATPKSVGTLLDKARLAAGGDNAQSLGQDVKE